jgi:hypothetical protein
MSHPPDPETRSPAAANGRAKAKSQSRKHPRRYSASVETQALAALLSPDSLAFIALLSPLAALLVLLALGVCR